MAAGDAGEVGTQWQGGALDGCDSRCPAHLRARRESGYPSPATRPASMKSSRVERWTLTYLPSLTYVIRR